MWNKIGQVRINTARNTTYLIRFLSNRLVIMGGYEFQCPFFTHFVKLCFVNITSKTRNWIGFSSTWHAGNADWMLLFIIHVLQIQNQDQDQHPLTVATSKPDHRLFIIKFLSNYLVVIYNSVSVLFPILLKRSKKFS